MSPPRARAPAVEVACPIATSPAVRAQYDEVRRQSRSLAVAIHAELERYPDDALDAHLRSVARGTRHLFQKWTVEIVYLLAVHRVMRFNELSRALPGISTRTLSAKLASLQALEFVTRAIYEEHPPRVEYSLSSDGYRLTQLLTPALAWSALPATAIATWPITPPRIPPSRQSVVDSSTMTAKIVARRAPRARMIAIARFRSAIEL